MIAAEPGRDAGLALPLRARGIRVDRLRAADADELARSHSDERNAQYQTWQYPLSRRAALAMIREAALELPMARGSACQLAIRERAGGPLAGDLYLSRPDHRAWELELGITLAPQWQGRGLATGAFRLAIAAAFAIEPPAEPVVRVVAFVDADNVPSRALMERAGLLLEGTHKLALRRRDGTLADEVTYAVTAGNWVG